MPTKTPPNLFQGEDWEKYKKYLVSKESLGRAVSETSLAHHNSYGYVGIYQMGVGALEDAGFLKPGTLKLRKSKAKGGQNLSQKEIMENDANWTAGNSYQSYITSEDKQSEALEAYTKKNYQSIKSTLKKKGLDTTNDAFAMLSASHLGGSGNAISYMNEDKGSKAWTDANGTTMATYQKGFYDFVGSPEAQNEEYKKVEQRITEISNDPNLKPVEKADKIESTIGEMTSEEQSNFNRGRQNSITSRQKALDDLNDTSTDEGFMLDLLKKNRSDWGLQNEGGKDTGSFEMDLSNLSEEEATRLEGIIGGDKFNNVKLSTNKNINISNKTDNATNDGSYRGSLTGSDIKSLLDPIDQLHVEGTGQSLFYNVTAKNLDGSDKPSDNASENYIDRQIKGKFYNSNITDRFDNEFEVSSIDEIPKTVTEDNYSPDKIEAITDSHIRRVKQAEEDKALKEKEGTGTAEGDTNGDGVVDENDDGFEKDFLNEYTDSVGKKPAFFTDNDEEPTFGDFLKKNPNAPASMVLAVKGLIDAGKSVQDINVEDTSALSDSFNKHFEQMEQMSTQGFTPEEEALHRKKINDGFNASMAQVVRASGGNRNLVLANAAGIASARNKSTLESTVADAQLRRSNLKAFEDVLYYQEQFNERKDLREQANEYRVKSTQRTDDLATKQSGGVLAASSMKGILDSIGTYNETGPGSAFHQMQQYMTASVRDRLTEINPETGKAYANEQEYIDQQKRAVEEQDVSNADRANVNLWLKDISKKDMNKANEYGAKIDAMSVDTRKDFLAQMNQSDDMQTAFNTLYSNMDSGSQEPSSKVQMDGVTAMSNNTVPNAEEMAWTNKSKEEKFDEFGKMTGDFFQNYIM